MTLAFDGDRLLAAASEARDALIADGQSPGAHLESTREGEWAATHYFEADLPGYRGWQWCVVLAGSPGTDHLTVSEIVLLPGDDALLSPSWIPWAERVASGDLSPGDMLAAPADDPRLVPNQVDTDDEFRLESDEVDPDDVGQVVGELGLGRRRLLSPAGRDDAAQRWYDGEYGPGAEMAQAAAFPCFSCGFFIPLAGALRAAFGVCGNEYSADGHVVSVEYGCGGHSDVEAPRGEGSPAYAAYDDGALEIVGQPTPAGADAS